MSATSLYIFSDKSSVYSIHGLESSDLLFHHHGVSKQLEQLLTTLKMSAEYADPMSVFLSAPVFYGCQIELDIAAEKGRARASWFARCDGWCGVNNPFFMAKLYRIQLSWSSGFLMKHPILVGHQKITEPQDQFVWNNLVEPQDSDLIQHLKKLTKDPVVSQRMRAFENQMTQWWDYDSGIVGQPPIVLEMTPEQGQQYLTLLMAVMSQQILIQDLGLKDLTHLRLLAEYPLDVTFEITGGDERRIDHLNVLELMYFMALGQGETPITERQFIRSLDEAIEQKSSSLRQECETLQKASFVGLLYQVPASDISDYLVESRIFEKIEALIKTLEDLCTFIRVFKESDLDLLSGKKMQRIIRDLACLRSLKELAYIPNLFASRLEEDQQKRIPAILGQIIRAIPEFFLIEMILHSGDLAFIFSHLTQVRAKKMALLQEMQLQKKLVSMQFDPELLSILLSGLSLNDLSDLFQGNQAIKHIVSGNLDLLLCLWSHMESHGYTAKQRVELSFERSPFLDQFVLLFDLMKNRMISFMHTARDFEKISAALSASCPARRASLPVVFKHRDAGRLDPQRDPEMSIMLVAQPGNFTRSLNIFDYLLVRLLMTKPGILTRIANLIHREEDLLLVLKNFYNSTGIEVLLSLEDGVMWEKLKNISPGVCFPISHHRSALTWGTPSLSGEILIAMRDSLIREIRYLQGLPWISEERNQHLFYIVVNFLTVISESLSIQRERFYSPFKMILLVYELISELKKGDFMSILQLEKIWTNALKAEIESVFSWDTIRAMTQKEFFEAFLVLTHPNFFDLLAIGPGRTVGPGVRLSKQDLDVVVYQQDFLNLLNRAEQILSHYLQILGQRELCYQDPDGISIFDLSPQDRNGLREAGLYLNMINIGRFGHAIHAIHRVEKCIQGFRDLWDLRQEESSFKVFQPRLLKQVIQPLESLARRHFNLRHEETARGPRASFVFSRAPVKSNGQLLAFSASCD